MLILVNLENVLFIIEFLIEGENIANSWSNTTGQSNNSALPLAAERTRRIDPSSHFSYYEAGWDITNKHYILSLAFSGIPLFVIAAFWCFTVATCFTIIACCYCCGHNRKKSRTDYSRKAYTISLIFLSVFLIVTIIGCIFLYNGQGNFQSTARDVSDILVMKANSVVDIVHNVLRNLAAAKKIEIAQYYLPDDIKHSIGKVERFANQSSNIKSQPEKIAKFSTELLNDISRSLVAVSAGMLILTVVGFSNGVGDTCAAMDDWLQHPQDHNTALSKLLPCMDEAAARRTLDITRNTSFQITNLVNAFVVNVANNHVPPFLQDFYYNQSGPFMPLLCNPFFPNLTERTCGPSELNLKGAPTAYQSFVCDTSPSGLCMTMGRLTPSLYTQVLVATNMSDTLHRYGPFLSRVVDCTFVAETFAQINEEDCPLLRRYSNQVFIGLVLVSVAVMFSVILWLVFVRERWLQISSKKLRTPYAELR
ncbi:uncharacterized protein LOC133286633 [Gastrolobium bilobum]|uniref:uncharacterized protein LOC133286633 n=1 Tax=Gastrolobium bilobum TaxID=150636 RepID=UPI002AB2F41D|nr:uncharacterized protein LOC133286633 [Gastrolobium bilobum]